MVFEMEDIPYGTMKKIDAMHSLNIDEHLELAIKIYDDHVTCYLNGQPGYWKGQTTKEQMAVYELGLMVQAQREKIKELQETIAKMEAPK
jgi:hypothetical protein